MKKGSLFILLMLFLFFSCKKEEDNIPDISGKYEPISSGEIVKHTYYTLSYCEAHEQAYWVYYISTPEFINGTQTRTDDFRTDPLVSTGSATLKDYEGSGYDRGHLCPADDMKLNKTSMSETFFLSNISPQNLNFNRGIWLKLENQARKWTLSFGKLYVVTGAIFKDNIGKIGLDSVTVPGYFYKVLYDGQDKMIGLVIPNKSSNKSLDQFVVTVDKIEEETNIDFFSELEDQTENQLEGNINLKGWF